MSHVGVDANLHGNGSRPTAIPKLRSRTIQAFGAPAANPHILARMIGLH
jgi:hypothetical protein